MSRLPASSPEEARWIETMRAVDAASRPSPFELARARSRLGTRAWAPRAPRARFIPWAGALLLAAGGAFGLGRSLQLSSSSPPPAAAPMDPPSRVLEESPPRKPRPEAPSEPAPAPEPLMDDTVQGESLAAPVAPPRTKAPSLSSQSSPHSASTAAPPEPGWRGVAQALRAGDRQAAERELERLSDVSRGAERQSAELALAQLHLTAGELAKARPILKRLARSNTNPLVASRARELLQELPDASDPSRGSLP